MLQLLFLTTHYKTTTNNYINELPLYTVPQYITRKQHPSHDNYLYRRWNKPTHRTQAQDQKDPYTTPTPSRHQG